MSPASHHRVSSTVLSTIPGLCIACNKYASYSNTRVFGKKIIILQLNLNTRVFIIIHNLPELLLKCMPPQPPGTSHDVMIVGNEHNYVIITMAYMMTHSPISAWQWLFALQQLCQFLVVTLSPGITLRPGITEMFLSGRCKITYNKNTLTGRYNLVHQ